MPRCLLVTFTMLSLLAACSAEAPTNPVRTSTPQALLSNTAPGLVGYWPGDGTARDLAGGHDGALLNGATYACGRYGQAFSFDGFDDQVFIPAAADLDVGQADGFSFAAWIFPMGLEDAQGGSGPIVEYVGGTHFWVYAQTPDTSLSLHSLYLNIYPGHGDGYLITAPGVVTQFAWNHVATTYSKTTGLVTHYVNGVPVLSIDVGRITPSTATDLNLGYRGPTNAFGPGFASFLGLLDEVQIYNRPLDPTEIQTLASATPTSICPTYPFTGFFQPVDNRPSVNGAKAGSAIPVKFSLGGDKGLDIFLAGYPGSQNQACDGSAADPIEQTVTANASGLTYSVGADVYTYVWKTDPSWRNTCRRLELRLKDGSSHSALFQFK